MQATNPLRALSDFGQSVWLDYIERKLLTSGELQRMVERDGVRGVTSNPAIFQKAITTSHAYDDIVNAPNARGLDAQALYERLAIRDICDAADVLKAVYDRSQGKDGYVSLEVSPKLARDTERTLDEARRLWRAVARPNLMIKVPATPQGIPAVRQLIAEGINVNVTLLFSQSAYAEVAAAYIDGVERLAHAGGDLNRIASVASFFVSRIDSAVDTLLAARASAAASERERGELSQLAGKAAIANAKQTYQKFLRLFSGTRWQALAGKGARPQRVLWASTGTKNAAYRDVLYVEELVGPDTVNTIPLAALDAFRNHGRPRASLVENVNEADATMTSLSRLGIRMDEITDRLLEGGIVLFVEAFDALLTALQRRQSTLHASS